MSSLSPHELPASPTTGGSGLLMLVLVRSSGGVLAQADAREEECARIASDMVLDLLNAEGLPATQESPNTLAARPADATQAIAFFYHLQALFTGLATCAPGDRLRFILLVSNETERPIGSSPALLPETPRSLQGSGALLLSSSVHNQLRMQPELGFTRVPTGSFDLRRLHPSMAWFQLVPAPGWETDGSLPPLPPRASSRRASLSPSVLPGRIALWLLTNLRPKIVLGATGAIALVLIIGVITLIYRAIPHRPAAPKNQLVQASRPGSPAPPPSISTQPATSTAEAHITSVASTPKVDAAQPPDTLAPPKPAKPADAKSKEAVDGSRKTTDETNGEQPPKRSGMYYTPEQLREMVDNADHLAGDGKYDAAIALYERVIARDPKNEKAKRGLARARENKALR